MIKLPLDQNGYPVLILGIGECQDSTGGKITPVGDVMRLAANAASRIWYYPSTEVKRARECCYPEERLNISLLQLDGRLKLKET